MTALLRELEEETGLSVLSILNVISDFDYTSETGRKTRQITYVVTVEDTTVLKLSDEHDSHLWVDETELCSVAEVDEIMSRLCVEALQEL